MEINPISMAKIHKKAENIYEAVIVASLKAKKINDEYRLEYNTLLNSLPSAGIEDEFDEKDNADKLAISLEFEKRKKAHLTALEQLVDGEIDFRYKEENE
ncbi:MAG: DNA-directed RNA polymerase subunit omega [Melioribacteraceae bacterium]|nr:DNA-directed RNA polymerase subunit omega [Melioribacteraceae bacterium]